MNKTIHELINMKSRKEELEIEMGNRRVEDSHLASIQKRHIEEDARRNMDPEIMLDAVNEKIREDERRIRKQH
ncbi:MAG: hypothetical protein K8R73_09200 [Clostridiales bacterium]|nr:hypothetical protein [Clostridiales bacterium]